MAHRRKDEMVNEDITFNASGLLLTTTNNNEGLTYADDYIAANLGAGHNHANFAGFNHPIEEGEKDPSQLDRIESKMDRILEMLNTGLTNEDIEILGDLQLDKDV
jgi:hypothetical protein